MMKKRRLTRLFSLFAAMLMCVSLLSAVASASDGGIQPHRPSCPICGGDTYDYLSDKDMNTSWNTKCHTGSGVHFDAWQYRHTACYTCGEIEKVREHSGYFCTGGCGAGYHWYY